MLDLNSIYIDTLKKLVSNGSKIEAQSSLSIGSNRDYLELFNYQFVIKNPLYRLINPEFKIFNLYTGIGRFLWLLRGSNSLEEIEYYDKNVKNFSDDGIIIPGSSFGNRIFSTTKINQFDNVVDLLKKDKTSRRGAISIFQPPDTLRESKDIPCLFGLFFHIRDNKLLTTVIMRSNNALKLLPYNFFEISLLSEIMASLLHVDLGSIYYQAVSMHMYIDDMTLYSEIVKSYEPTNQKLADTPFLSSNELLLSLEMLQQFEKDLRTNSRPIVQLNIEQELNSKMNLLPEKLFQFYLILLDYYLIKNKKNTFRHIINPYISRIYKKYLWQ